VHTRTPTCDSLGSLSRAGLLSCRANLTVLLGLAGSCGTGMDSEIGTLPSSSCSADVLQADDTELLSVQAADRNGASDLAVPNCAAAAANGCGGSCCGCVCMGCGFGCARRASCTEPYPPAPGLSCRPNGPPRLLAVLSTAGEAAGALLLRSQLEELLQGRHREDTWLNAMLAGGREQAPPGKAVLDGDSLPTMLPDAALQWHHAMMKLSRKTAAEITNNKATIYAAVVRFGCCRMPTQHHALHAHRVSNWDTTRAA
jgi:hypothetical protein